ncbi:rhomboid family intramembrane serine protease [Verrucomicrobiota bacterium sgz303538]
MSWINRAEAKFGHIAIPGLPRIIVGFNALVFVLYNLNPNFLGLLTLDPNLVMQGQVWRLVTHVFIPSFGGILPGWFSAALYMLFLWFIGNGCEQAMGSFKFTWYYVIGMIGITAATFFFGGNFSNFLLNTSLLFAFARFYPEVVIYLFFVLPVKVKWVAWISGALLVLEFLTGSWSYRASMLVALSNYFLFFGPGMISEARHRNEVAARRRRFESEARAVNDEPLHRCAICGRTEVNAPHLEFRVAKDGQEYCLDHIPKPPTVSHSA